MIVPAPRSEESGDSMSPVYVARASEIAATMSAADSTQFTRCPGLAYMEGVMRGPSSADCEKSFVRTGIRPPDVLGMKPAPAPLVGIAGLNSGIGKDGENVLSC